jgi:hypothetical protein
MKLSCLLPRDVSIGGACALALCLAACGEVAVEMKLSGELLRDERLKAGSYMAVTLNGMQGAGARSVSVCLEPQAGAVVNAQGIVLDPERGTPAFTPELSLVSVGGEHTRMLPIPAARAAGAPAELCYEPAAPRAGRDYAMLQLSTPLSFTVHRLVWKAS